MLDRIEAAGNPAVEKGEALARDLRAALAKAEALFRDARRKAAVLPDDPQEFATAVSELGTSLAASSRTFQDNLKSTLQKYDVPELHKSFSEVPACKALEPGG